MKINIQNVNINVTAGAIIIAVIYLIGEKL